MTDESVGGKFSKLKSIRSAGFLVPPFFVTTVEFYNVHFQKFLRTQHDFFSQVNWTNLEEVKRLSDLITQQLIDVSIAPEHSEELFQLHSKWIPKSQLCAVRSCMISQETAHGEDSASNPFAGISETFLCVEREQLLDRVRRCLASGYTLEALLYRHGQGIPQGGFAVSVAVQAMVSSTRSFVAFDCNPNTGEKETLIVAGFGLGEGVVQEKVPVDHFVVRGTSIHSEISEKESQILRRTDGSLGIESVSRALSSKPVCTPSELFAIRDAASVLSSLFEAPQDIEGAFDSSGALSILQSRPISFDFERVRLWSSANVSESFPGVSSPLTFTFAQKFYRELNYDFYRKCGVTSKVLQSAVPTFDRLLGYLNGRIFHCITHFHKMTKINPLFALFKGEFDRLVAELDRSYHSPLFETERRSRLDSILHSVSFSKVLLKSLFWLIALPRSFATFENWWQVRLAQDKSFARREKQSILLVSRYLELWKEVEFRWGITLINYQFMILFHMLTESCLKTFALDPKLMSGLLCGGPQLKGVEVVLSAVHLAELAEKEGQRESFFQGSSQEVYRDIKSGRLGPKISCAFETHLELYGARGLQELKLEVPNLSDTPWVLVEIVKNYLASGVSAQDLSQGEAQLARETREKLKQSTPGVLGQFKRTLVLFLSRQLRATLVRRELGRYMRSELFALGKIFFQGLAKDLCQQGILREPEDIFCLTQSEVFGLVEGTSPAFAIGEVIQLRKQSLKCFENLSSAELPKEFSTSGIVSTQLPKSESLASPKGDTGSQRAFFKETGRAQGLGSSFGRIVGRVRIVHEASLSLKLSKTDILVAKETDPGWLFLMLQAGGIVVERGSVLSHTAITGRKFGIPTVVGLAGVTEWLQEGSLIQIDGATGEVFQQNEEPSS